MEPTGQGLTWPQLRQQEMARYPEVYAAYQAFLRAVEAGEPIDPDRPFITVHRVEDIPAFADEEEEHEFWGVHELGPELFDRPEATAGRTLPLPPARPRTRPVAIRFDGDILRRLKGLAAKKGTGYQTLLKEFVIERLYEEEKREGLIGDESAVRGPGGRRFVSAMPSPPQSRAVQPELPSTHVDRAPSSRAAREDHPKAARSRRSTSKQTSPPNRR